MAALHHGGYENCANVEIHWIQSEDVTDDNVAELFKVWMAFWCRADSETGGLKGKLPLRAMLVKKRIPFFGICLGYANCGR